MKSIASFLVIALSAAICHAAAIDPVNGLYNGGFETPSLSGGGLNYYPSTPAGFGWTLESGGDIDHVREYWQPSEGLQSVDLNGWNKGSIYQDFQFTAAGWWLIQFDMSANPEIGGVKSLVLTLGQSGQMNSLGTYSVDSAGRSFANMQWVPMASPEFYVPDANATYRVQFSSLVPGASGPTLDNVRLVTVPEPTALALGALVLGLSILRAKRA